MSDESSVSCRARLAALGAGCLVQDLDDCYNLTPLVDAIGLLIWPGVTKCWSAPLPCLPCRLCLLVEPILEASMAAASV